MTPTETTRARSPFRAVLFGVSLDVGNLGVRALGASLIRLIKEAEPDARVTLFHGNRDGGTRRLQTGQGELEIEIANFRLSPRAHPREHLVFIFLLALLYRLLPIPPIRRALVASNTRLRTIAEADFVGDIAGGDSFSDIYGMRRLLTTMAPSLIALLLGKQLVLLPQTYGPYNSASARFLARYVLRRAAAVYSRDESALPMLRELVGPGAAGKEIAFCPDVAFVLEPIEPPAADIRPPLPSADSSDRGLLVGVNINGLLYMGGYTGKNMFGLRFDYREFVERLVVRILEETDARVMLVPHVFQSAQNDSAPCRSLHEKLSERFPGRLHYVEGSYDQSQIKAIIRRCDFFLGSRMHPCIAALSLQIPAVGIAYSHKFIGVFKSVGAGEMVLDARQLDADRMLDACLDRLQRHQAIASELEVTIPRAKDRLRTIFRTQLVKNEATAPVARDLILEGQER